MLYTRSYIRFYPCYRIFKDIFFKGIKSTTLFEVNTFPPLCVWFVNPNCGKNDDAFKVTFWLEVKVNLFVILLYDIVHVKDAAVNKALKDVDFKSKEHIKSKTKDIIPDIPGFDIGNIFKWTMHFIY